MLRQALALVAVAAALILGFMFSLVLIAVVVVLGLVAWGYLWWKTRDLRRAMGERAVDDEPDGQVIEGEAVVVEEAPGRDKPTLPGDPPAEG